ncbi:hypothetical protein SAMN04489712_107186 [Thermomonospora echinospora]|uniref:Catalytic LigB subunit of aromatic ring-opening dioxygenase n=1 Tax=Thermomonospora echinospora TaxID=1992 RepID=A0A1H6BKA9_9ACTN|nr:hypothetical protein [Thermomonospora echinospora]SEG61123.1 hypothetical protein SAMN04489712_107186 [Thermomonospora echinospora]
MLIAAAVCPHPPMLVPELMGEAAPELDGLRAACAAALRRLRSADPDPIVVVGGADTTRAFGPDARGDLRPYGLDLQVGGAPGGPCLPLSLTIGAWLLHRLGGEGLDSGRVRYQAVASGASPGECARLGVELAGAGRRVGLLVMGDGSACRSQKAPGYLDERAAPYDAGVARALGRADAAALAALDPGLSGKLQVAGRAAWQVLAGAAGEGAFRAELLADEAPYGVGYLVADWLRA